MTLFERVEARYRAGSWGVVVDDQELLLDALNSVAEMYLDPDGFWVDNWEDEDFVRTALGVGPDSSLPDRSELTENFLVEHLTDEEIGSAIESALEDHFAEQGWPQIAAYNRRLMEARERYRATYDPGVDPDVALQPIESLDLSIRVTNALKGAGLNTIGDLVRQAEDDLLRLPRFGLKSLDDVVLKLDERQLFLMPEPEILPGRWKG